MVDAGYHYGNFSASQLHPQLRHYAPIYVDPVNGSDTNDGSSASSAMQSLPRALGLARPGNRIVMTGGTYQGGDLTFTHSGIPGREIILQGMNGAAIDATGSQRGFLLVGLSYITLDGLDISGASESGIEIRSGFGGGTHRKRIEQHHHPPLPPPRQRPSGSVCQRGICYQYAIDTVDHNGSRGVQVETGQVDIQGSAVNANPDSGLWAISGSTVTVSGSQFVNNATDGVLVDHSNVTISGGSISGSKDGGARFTHGSTGSLTGVSVVNNADVGVQGISSTVSITGGKVENSARWSRVGH